MIASRTEERGDEYWPRYFEFLPTEDQPDKDVSQNLWVLNWAPNPQPTEMVWLYLPCVVKHTN